MTPEHKSVSRKLTGPLVALLGVLLLAGCVDDPAENSGTDQGEGEQPGLPDHDLSINMRDYEFVQSDFQGIPVGHKIYFYNADDVIHRPVHLQGAWDVGDVEPGTGAIFEVPDTGDTNQHFECEYHGDEPHNMRATMFVE